jgi:transcriptional regulator with XRE-family HTH domain
MDMADRIKQRRKQLELTQTQLAEKSGMKQQMIQQLEARKVLTTGRLLALARALDVCPQWLETGEGPMQESATSREDRELLDEVQALGPEEKVALRVVIRAMRQGLHFNQPKDGFLNFDSPKPPSALLPPPPNNP